MMLNWMYQWYSVVQEIAEQKLQRSLTVLESQALRKITSAILLKMWERDLETVTSPEESERWMAEVVRHCSP